MGVTICSQRAGLRVMSASVHHRFASGAARDAVVGAMLHGEALTPCASEQPGRWVAPWVRHAVSTVVFVTAVGLTVGWLQSGLGGHPGATGLAGTAIAAQTTDLGTRAGAGSSTCHDPDGEQSWRVRWRSTGSELSATGFDLRPDGAQQWSDRGAATWALRWDLTAAQLAGSGTSRINERRGTLAQLSRTPIPPGLSPRFVTPDGACTVYVAAFGNGSSQWPEVAVLGDSLVGQLRDARNSGAFRQGLVQGELNRAARPRRVEVVGQGGRRWTPVPDGTSGQLQADHLLLDEIRGLRGVPAQVLALGTNDAGWVALAPDEREFGVRLDWVLEHLPPVLDELARSGQCAVVVTAADEPARYLGSDPDRFARAAHRINDHLRQRAQRSDQDSLRLWDWARQAAEHHTDAAEPWFGSDTIHLNQPGRHAYADNLTRAAGAC
jgi:lysophospholipase L1-like esterase